MRKAVDGRWIEPDKRKQLPGIGDRFRPRGAVHVALMLLRRSRSFQQRLSTLDAEQQKLDQQLDKSLNICRC